MAIVGALLGLGVGAFSNLGRADRQATGQLKDALRAARLFALRSSAPASVIVDPVRGEVVGTGLLPVGNWHFEDDAGTGWPVPARHGPGALERRGVIGSALRLTRDDTLVIGGLPSSFDSPHGFGVDVALRPESDVRPLVLLQREGSWRLRLDEEDRLEVSLWFAATPQPLEFRQSFDLTLSPERYTQVSLNCDGRTLSLSLDGRRVVQDTRFDPPRKVHVPAGALLDCGTEVDRFRGWIDELRISSVIEGDHAPLPAEISLQGGPRVLRLDEFGHLDPAWHREPELIEFRVGDSGPLTHVELGLLGSVRSWTDAP